MIKIDGQFVFISVLETIEASFIMKINEGTLAALAVSKETPADKEGWLWKRGEVNKAFQKRYFVLRGNLLFYFEHRRLETAETSSCPSGVIVLEGCTVELAEEDLERFAFKIRFHCGSDLNCRDGNSSSSRRRVYHLGTDSQAIFFHIFPFPVDLLFKSSF